MELQEEEEGEKTVSLEGGREKKETFFFPLFSSSFLESDGARCPSHTLVP